ncbi:SAM-dependent methyltransferase [Streptosporangiaceae bacterium NEAU-GS5]|nr:SAM-dependent methyltransferase [Streptosporangiaceae bacterium NEAU-GS5]
MSDPDPPIVIDPTIPSTARMYDYMLGGKDNFPADREAAEQIIELGRQAGFDLRDITRANRAFLVRVVRTLAESGVRQFLDIGTGLPTQQNVHQVAQSVAPDARTVYVDNDPIVLTHARALLADSPQTIAMAGDLREPAKILADPAIRAHLDFDQPFAIIAFAILDLIVDDDLAAHIMATLRGELPSGGYLAISHGYARILGVNKMDEAHELFQSRRVGDFAHRPPAMVATYFKDLELLEPGVVPVELWRPTYDQWPGDPDNSGFIGAVGRKP